MTSFRKYGTHAGVLSPIFECGNSKNEIRQQNRGIIQAKSVHGRKQSLCF